MPAYQHLFFDLDHTLWDFHRNSEETLHQLYNDFQLKSLGAKSASLFIETYKQINHQLWDDYQKGKISKELLRNSRFRSAFKASGFDGEHIADSFSEQYLQVCPTKPHLLPNAREVLDYLQGKYNMSIITNGFAEVQHIKLKQAGIDGFFSHVFISEIIGFQKPDARIFQHAAAVTGAATDSSLMIGDNYETDISGAINAGFDHVYFNPQQVPHKLSVQKEISDLKELMEIL